MTYPWVENQRAVVNLGGSLRDCLVASSGKWKFWRTCSKEDWLKGYWNRKCALCFYYEKRKCDHHSRRCVICILWDKVRLCCVEYTDCKLARTLPDFHAAAGRMVACTELYSVSRTILAKDGCLGGRIDSGGGLCLENYRCG